MKLFLEMFFASFLFVGLYLMVYLGLFSVCLSDDVEFHYGKKRMRNRRKKQKGFLRKFLFLDISKEVIPWHYAMFWVNFVSAAVVLIMLNVCIAYSNKTARIILLISAGSFFLTAAITAFIRWPLYAGNKVRNRKKCRNTFEKK